MVVGQLGLSGAPVHDSAEEVFACVQGHVTILCRNMAAPSVEAAPFTLYHAIRSGVQVKFPFQQFYYFLVNPAALLMISLGTTTKKFFQSFTVETETLVTQNVIFLLLGCSCLCLFLFCRVAIVAFWLQISLPILYTQARGMHLHIWTAAIPGMEKRATVLAE